MYISKPPTLAPLLFLFIICSYFKVCYCTQDKSISCPEVEKKSLLSFKQSLKDPSAMLSSWRATVDCCRWNGVVCNNETGHVQKLHLPCNNMIFDPRLCLSGNINPSLLDLRHLEYLNLSLNNFNETIPSFIGSLASLEHLDLSYTAFQGGIPHSIGNLSNLLTLRLEERIDSLLFVDNLEWLWGLSKLEYLNMNGVYLRKAANWKQVIYKLPSLIDLHFSSCSLDSSLSSHVNISRSNLATLDLSNNHMAKVIPEWIFQLTKLTFLDLSSNGFEGQVPMNANCTKLQHIDLSKNNLNSSIPDWLYSSTHLEFVNLGSNKLQGNISNAIANLTSLTTLDLSVNALSGEIPREVGTLCKIQSLDLSYNELGGDISGPFGNMSDCFLGSMKWLILVRNNLSGNLTHRFGAFKCLVSLMLGRNSLSGSIPSNIGNLSSLEVLYMPYNRMSGNLPESVGQLFNLKQLFLEYNMLEGVVTESHFAHLSELKYFSASGNHLALKLRDPNWIPPFKLRELYLASWSLGPDSRIFSWLQTQKNSISVLDLSSAGISSDVPVWLWSIRYLNLSHNQLCGEIPFIGKPEVFHYCQFIYLSTNNFSGPLPRVGNEVVELDLSNNSFSGGMSHFLCDNSNQPSLQLYILDRRGNHLSGELPDCWGNWPMLLVLNLGNNHFSGVIPNSLGSLETLYSLNLNNNKFSGQIPLSIQKCKHLLKMDFAHNNLEGDMPTWIGTSFYGLKYLMLHSNNLSGEINPSICQLSSLRILDLSNNRFSGLIPRCIDNFIAMSTNQSSDEGDRGYSEFIEDYHRDNDYYYVVQTFLESATVRAKGYELHYDTILPLFRSIDLSGNILSGDIPREITSLVELKSLNLSGNHFTGLIPDNIGNMKQLESLDFSRNWLSGEIPNSFTAMSSLEYLNLSCNNLTGRIPESTQLLSFSESSFTGNTLCGLPLTTPCGNEGIVPRPVNTENEYREHEKPEIDWFYVFLSLGYTMGLSAVLTTFFLMKTWRETCYKFLQSVWDNVYVFFFINLRRLRRAFSKLIK